MEKQGENQFFQELGEFIVNYENIIGNIKKGIIFLMHQFNNGGNNNYQECLKILLSEIESKKLLNKYGALLYLFIPKKHKYYNKIDELLKTTEKLNELRNNLIHRYYAIGYEMKTSKLSIESINQKTRKSGLTHNFLNLTYQDLSKINNEMGKIDKLLNGLHIIVNGEIIDYFKNFKIDEIKEIRYCFKKYLKDS